MAKKKAKRLPSKSTATRKVSLAAHGRAIVAVLTVIGMTAGGAYYVSRGLAHVTEPSISTVELPKALTSTSVASESFNLPKYKPATKVAKAKTVKAKKSGKKVAMKR